jgi:hypothetical protein
MKKAKAAIYSVILLCILLLCSTVPLGSCVSQTYVLTEEAYSGLIGFNLNVGDQVNGSFSVSNLGPYINVFTNADYYNLVDVWVIPPNAAPPYGDAILNLNATQGATTFKFNFTAKEQGLYQLFAYSGPIYCLIDAKKPSITINYEIINATASVTSEPTPSVAELPANALLAMFIVTPLIAVYYRKRKYFQGAAY